MPTKQEIQKEVKEKIHSLLNDYDVVYLDYNARDDEYTINLEKYVQKD